MLMLVCGNIREGKTLLVVDMANTLHLQNVDCGTSVPVYGNFKMFYPEAKFVDVDILLDVGLSDCFLGLDEVYTWLESRVSSSNLNRYVSYFIFQSGKLNVDVGATAQLGSSVDLRFFDLAHILVLAFNDKVNRRFVYDFIVRCGRGSRSCVKTLSYESAEKFWDMYVTCEPVAPLGLKLLQYEIDKFNVVKINARVDGVVARIRSEVDVFGWSDAKYVFRYQVEDWLLRVGEPLALAPLVTNRLKCSLR